MRPNGPYFVSCFCSDPDEMTILRQRIADMEAAFIRAIASDYWSDARIILESAVFEKGKYQ